MLALMSQSVMWSWGACELESRTARQSHVGMRWCAASVCWPDSEVPLRTKVVSRIPVGVGVDIGVGWQCKFRTCNACMLALSQAGGQPEFLHPVTRSVPRASGRASSCATLKASPLRQCSTEAARSWPASATQYHTHCTPASVGGPFLLRATPLFKFPSLPWARPSRCLPARRVRPGRRLPATGPGCLDDSDTAVTAAAAATCAHSEVKRHTTSLHAASGETSPRDTDWLDCQPARRNCVHCVRVGSSARRGRRQHVCALRQSSSSIICLQGSAPVSYTANVCGGPGCGHRQWLWLDQGRLCGRR